ncbi:MAG: hypothetical protein EXR66_05385 [Dehalococcoidia bacterium]|nr:hypothetical protein [Dehalococcoidia bacterium]
MLAAMYTHLDASNSFAASVVPGAARAPGVAPSGFAGGPGRGDDADGDSEDALPAGAHSGMGHHFTRYTSNGLRVESFVIWLDEAPNAPTPAPTPRRGR